MEVLSAVVVDQSRCSYPRKDVEYLLGKSSNEVRYSFAEYASKCSLFKWRQAVGDGVPHVNAKISKDLPHD